MFINALFFINLLLFLTIAQAIILVILVKKYKLSYLSYFLYGMLICWLSYLLNFLLKEVFINYFHIDIDYKIIIGLDMFRFPLLIIAHYIFMVYLVLLVKDRFPRSITIVYFALGIIAYVYYILALNQEPINGYKHNLETFFKIVFLVRTTFLILTSIYVCLLGLKEKLIEKRNFILFNGTYTLLLFIIGILDSFGVISIFNQGVFSHILKVTQHIPLVFYFYYYIRKHYINIDDNSDYFRSIVSGYSLTKREKEILKSLLQGFSCKDISDSLYVSYKTVDKHMENIYRKLNIHNKIQLYNLFK